MPAITRSRHAELTGVQKAPRHEVAESWAPAGQRALWGFDVSAEVDGGCNAARKRSGCVDRRGGEPAMGISAALGAHQQALGALIAVIGSREITAGIEPARRNGKVVGGSSIGLGSCGSGRIGGLPGGLGFPGCPPMSKLRSGLTLEKTPPHLLSSAHRRLRHCRGGGPVSVTLKHSYTRGEGASE